MFEAKNEMKSTQWIHNLMETIYKFQSRAQHNNQYKKDETSRNAYDFILPLDTSQTWIHLC